MPTQFPLKQKTEQGVQSVQSILEAGAIPPGLNWDDLRLFLLVSEVGSLRTAAARERVAVNTVRARLARLEEGVGERLLSRTPQGIALTEAGLHLRKLALAMQTAAVPADDVAAGAGAGPRELTVVASEALGSGWLAPRLFDLQREDPALTMTMICDNDLAADHSSRCDIQVGWQIPSNPDLIVSRLCSIHFMPFASRDYLARRGIPQTPHDLLRHSFIEQASPGVKSHLLDQLVGNERPPGFMPLRTNSSFALFWAVASSNGIAFMPTYSAVLADMLVPIDLPFQLKFDLFYSYKLEARSSRIVMSGIDWLKRCFDSELHPWFRAEFVHPRDFAPDAAKHAPLFKSFEPATSWA